MRKLLAYSASALVALTCLAPAPVAMAQVAADQGGDQTIVVPKDKSAAFRLDYPASEIVVAQPDTLALVATTDRSFYVRGKALGVTNILIYDQDHHLAQVVDVRVGYDVESLQADLAAALPGEKIAVANFAQGILLTGEVSNPSVAARAQAIAERYAPKAVENQLTIKASEQVEVDVRILEASHTALRDLGLNLNVQSVSGFTFSSGSPTLPSGQTAAGSIGVNHQFGNWSIDANLQALESKGVVRELARPNLIAMSGQQASFLAGGEFPFPIPNGTNGVTIEFRQYGVKLDVTPTVEDNGQIELKVAPEVSELDPKDGLNIQGFQVPAISIRRAATQIELGDGQSFAIAGLFQRDYSSTINQIPGASNVPVLGALFRSSDWQRNETELVIIVTPHLTAAANSVKDLPNPLQETGEVSAIDVILDGKDVAGKRPDNPDGDLRPVGSPQSSNDGALAPQADDAAPPPAARSEAAPSQPAADGQSQGQAAGKS
ncbi:MAG TPA: type II and III secretion system protein family protein [Caulobacteraceae bacterium]|nr:type II and III secretion system protein family protein [Caulobacteraceae bacterium]